MPGMVVEAAPTGGGVDVARRSIRRLAWAPLVWFERRSTASSTAGAGLMHADLLRQSRSFRGES